MAIRNNTKTPQSQHDLYEQQYKTARYNLLLVVAFTIINIVLLVTNSDTYFLFSAYIPYALVSFGMLYCRRFPEEFYTDGLETLPVLDDSVFTVLLLAAIIITLVYLLAWLLSSKHRVGWLVFMLVLFGIDTAGLLILNGISIDSLFDILFHAWVIYYLVLGINAHNKLKKLPVDVATVMGVDSPADTAADEPVADSAILRPADMSKKQRVLLEATVLNYDILYRRQNHTNELIVNGNVYDEIEGVIESDHSLEAVVDGHLIVAEFKGMHSIIYFDGEEVAKKLRLY
jgi:hypothetical protein